MKDGTTHLAYKAEHVVDLDTEMILAAEIYHADRPDTQTLEDSVNAAQTNQREAGSEQQIEGIVADKGYHANEQLANLHEHTPYPLLHDQCWLRHRWQVGRSHFLTGPYWVHWRYG
jgi:transposase